MHRITRLMVFAILAVALSGCAFLENHAASNYWSWCEPNCSRNGT